VDFENIQQLPNEKAINASDKILVFVGAAQTSMKIEMVKTLLMVKDAEIITMNQQGKNNLDFHICLYLGRYFETTNAATEFVVISNDKYYDYVLETLTSLGRKSKRLETKDLVSKTLPSKTLKPEILIPGDFAPIDFSLDDLLPKAIPVKVPKVAKPKLTATKEKTPKIVAPKKSKQKIPAEYMVFIDKIKATPAKNRPQKVKTLINAINSFSPIKQDETIIPVLEKLGIIQLQNTKVVYMF